MQTILAIDDQRDNLTTISAIVKSHLKNCNIISAISGKEGLQMAKKHSPDVILLDIIMPEMNGYEVCTKLKSGQLTKHIPVIMLTAIKTDMDSRVKALNLGADAFLSKPIDAIELTAQINVMLRIKIAEDKLRSEKSNLEDIVSERTLELIESESHYRELFENSPIPMWEEDFSEVKKKITALKKRGVRNFHKYLKKYPEQVFEFSNSIKILEINQPVLELHEAETKDELLQGFAKIFTPESYESFIGEIVAIAEGRSKFELEGIIKTLSGKEKCVQLNWVVVPGHEETLERVYVSTIDITKRKHAEQLLRESEHLLKKSQKTAALGSYVLDIQNKIWTSSSVLNEVFGLNESFTKSGNSWLDIVHTEDREMMNDYFAINVLKNKESFNKEYRIKRINDQAERWVHGLGELEYNDKGQATRMIGTIQDITDRKLAEEALALQSKRLSYIIEGTNAGTWDWNIQTGELILNERWADIMGYTLEELKPLNIDILTKNVHPQDLIIVDESLENLFIKKADYYDVEFRQPHKNGSWVWINARGKVIEWTKKGKPLRMSGTHLDITERKHAEYALKENEEKYRSLIQTTSEGFWMIDVNGITIEVNESLCKMLGYKRVEMLGKTPYDYVDSINHKIFYSQISKAGDEKQRNYEISLQSKKGDNVLTRFSATSVLDADGKYEGSFAFVTDVTEQRKAEDILRKSEERFDLAMQASKDGLYDWDLITNEVYFSSSWKKMLGYKDDELPNDISVWETLTHPNERDQSLLKLQDAIENKVRHYEVEFRMKHKHGHWVNILSRANFIFDKEGKSIRVVGTHADMTGIKKVEREIKTALIKAKESDRLKSAFLATMSHELRTPLNAIIGFSDIISEDLNIEEIISFNNTINSSGKHLLNIVEDLFDITLIETGEIKIIKEDFNLLKLLDEVDDVIDIEKQKIQKEHLSLKRNITSDYFNIILNTDPSKLKQIIINLLKNALKFTNIGEIQYGCAFEEINNQKMLKFFVQDTGIGVSNEKQKFIFDMFRQVDDTHTRVHGGTGIGLSISKKLVELIGGDIWLESTEGKGSTFFFTVPFNKALIKTNPSTKIVKIHTSNDPLTAKDTQSTILVVEDIESSYEFLKVILNKSGYKTTWIENGKLAVEACKNNPEIELVLMDINMPVMNGYEATKEIKKFKPDLPIIAQTAYAIAGDREKAIEAGCNDYISKPIKRENLILMIKGYLK